MFAVLVYLYILLLICSTHHSITAHSTNTMLSMQPEPEFRPPMSEVVQQLVRLVQRAGAVKRRSSDESGFSYRTPDHEAVDVSF